ncbi:MAG: hypothetical protein AAF599_19080, partial [Bacteroidota bacterium]
ELPVFEYEEIVQKTDNVIEREMGAGFVKVESDLVHNVIYGSIEFAEDAGLAPHRDFNITEYILEDVETIPFMDIEFGKDGKLFYIPGPDDNVNKVLSALNKHIGSGNYDFLVDVRGMF